MMGELAHQPPDSGEGDGLLGDVCLPRPLTALNGVPGQQDPRLDWRWPRSSPAVPAGVCSLLGIQPLILAWLSPRGCLQCRLSPLTLTHPLERQSEPRPECPPFAAQAPLPAPSGSTRPSSHPSHSLLGDFLDGGHAAFPLGGSPSLCLLAPCPQQAAGPVSPLSPAPAGSEGSEILVRGRRGRSGEVSKKVKEGSGRVSKGIILGCAAPRPPSLLWGPTWGPLFSVPGWPLGCFCPVLPAGPYSTGSPLRGRMDSAGGETRWTEPHPVT